MNTILEKVKNTLTSRFGIPQEFIQSESDLVDDLGLDSLDLVEFFMISEEQYDLVISDSEAESVKKVMDIVHLIERHSGDVRNSAQTHELSQQRKYDAEAELMRYVLRHYRHLMTSAEQRTDIFISKDMKAQGYSNGDPERYKKFLKKLKIVKDKEITELLKDGSDAFYYAVCQRLLQSPQLIINRCLKCKRIVESPKARQCLWCGNDWHDNKMGKEIGGNKNG